MSPGRSLNTDSGFTSQTANCNKEHDSISNRVNSRNTDEPTISTYTTTSSTDSPSNSVRSNEMSIVSLDDDDVDSSSVADSDSDDDHVPSQSEFMAGALSSAKSREQNKICSGGNGVIVINNAGGGLISGGDSTRPNIGSIALQNSSDITFGDKKYFQAPVTIKKYYLEKDQWVRRDGDAAASEGNENLGFEQSNGDMSGGPNKSIPATEKEQLWHKRLLLEKRPLMLTLIVAAFLLLSATIVTSTYFLVHNDINTGLNETPGDGDDYRQNIPINSTIGDDLLPFNGESLRFISRSQWLAQPPEAPLFDLDLPSTRVIIAHTATENCSNQAICTFRVRFFQTFHIESLHFDDIGYNFLVGGDGAAYEGRGWDKEGAHTKGFNKRTICIAFIGTFNKISPPERQLRAAQLVIKQGLDLKKLSPDYKLYGHRQLMGTESPGATLYEIIKKWPHWENRTIV